MKYKRLSIQEIAEMKQMVKSGVAPEDLSKHFGIAVSSVHNYKKQFKAEGLKFPDVRGKRPSHQEIKPSGEARRTVESVKTQTTPVKPGTTTYNQFIVNGMAVQIDANAKSVNIGDGVIRIEF